ncbi:hypothetical protein EV121DRAFT_271812 [Schizophyllum commune]
MPFNWNLFGAANQVSEPIYGDDEDLDAPFVAVDPFRTSVQPRRGRWACPDTNDDDLEEQGVKAKLRRASVYGERTARASSAFAAFLWRFVPATLYLCVLFRLPALYFSRVARVFENAELCRRDSIRMAAARATQWEKALGSSHASGGSQDRAYGGIRNYGYGYHFHEPQGDMLSFPLLQFKKTWEQFIDNLLQEWKIEAAAADPILRTAALLALICTLMSLLYGCLYTVRSIISFIVSIMAFVWRTGASGEPADLVASPSQLLASRVITSVSLALGAVCFVLVVRTFTRYGDRIDRRWRENVHEQIRHERQLKASVAGFKGRAPAEGRCSPPMGEMRERKEPSPRVNTSPILQIYDDHKYEHSNSRMGVTAMTLNGSPEGVPTTTVLPEMEGSVTPMG